MGIQKLLLPHRAVGSRSRYFDDGSEVIFIGCQGCLTHS